MQPICLRRQFLRIAEKVQMGCVPERFSLLSVYTDDSFCTL